MIVNFEKELPSQLVFLVNQISEVVLPSMGKIPYTSKTLHNLMSTEKIERIKIGKNTAIKREDLAALLDRKLNKAGK